MQSSSELNPLSNSSRASQNDVEMDNATSDNEEARVVQHLLVPMMPQAFAGFQTPHQMTSLLGPPTASKPLPHLPPDFPRTPPMHPALTINNVPFTFSDSTQNLHSNTSTQALRSLASSGLPLLPRNESRERIQRSRSRSRSPRAPGPPSPRPVEVNNEGERHLEGGTGKIRLVGIEDPQKDALIASLADQLSKSNRFIETFERQLQEVKADTEVLRATAQDAENRAKKAEKDLADQKLKSDERLRKLEKTLKYDAAEKIILAEQRAQSMLLDFKGLRRPPHSIAMQHDAGREDAMVLDQPDAAKGKQRAGRMLDTAPPRLVPPAPPGFPRPASPPKHPHSQKQLPSVPSSSAQSVAQPLKVGRPRSLGGATLPNNDSSGSESVSSTEDEDGEEESSSPRPHTYAAGLNSEELLKLLLTTLGVNTANPGFSPRRRKGHLELKDPVRRRANGERKTKLMNWLRQHLHYLIGIKKTRDVLNFKDDIFATHTELQRSMALWEKDKSGDGPTVEPMKINWRNLEGPWNCRLCELFVQYCVEQGLEGGNPSEAVTEFVSDYFWDRLQRLRAVVRKNRPEGEEDPETHSARVNGRHLEALVTARRNTRRNQTFKDRIDICLDNLPRTADEIVTDDQRLWKVRHDVVQALGPEGMSSDESDTEGRPKTFIIKKLPWHNRRLIEIMNSIDKSRNTTNAYGNTRPGNSPRVRVRIEKAKKSARKKAPTGKPVDLYDLGWYEALKYQKKVALKAKSALNY